MTGERAKQAEIYSKKLSSLTREQNDKLTDLKRLNDEKEELLNTVDDLNKKLYEAQASSSNYDQLFKENTQLTNSLSALE